MKIFFDTEFIEDGKTIDLISIGMVREDGATLYLENADCDLTKASPWVIQNVIPHLTQKWTKKTIIKSTIISFVGPEKPEFWAYYADYDWVALCQLYGTMMDLPQGWPMFCMDLKQLAVSRGLKALPSQKGVEHNALNDAIWVKQAWEHIEALT